MGDMLKKAYDDIMLDCPEKPMTSKLKCPVCQQELHKDPDGYYSCYTDNCSVMSAGGNGASGTESLWTALIQVKQDLEIARKALEEMQHWLGVVRCSMISHLNNQNNTLLEHYETDPTVQNIDKAKSVLKHYIKQIEHKE